MLDRSSPPPPNTIVLRRLHRTKRYLLSLHYHLVSPLPSPLCGLVRPHQSLPLSSTSLDILLATLVQGGGTRVILFLQILSAPLITFMWGRRRWWTLCPYFSHARVRVQWSRGEGRRMLGSDKGEAFIVGHLHAWLHIPHKQWAIIWDRGTVTDWMEDNGR